MQSGLRSSTAQPKVSYSSVVKGAMEIESTRAPAAIARSTLISTTDAPRPATNMQGGAACKVPFKLIPLMPPKKHDVIKNTLTVANSGKINNVVPKKVEMSKWKLKTVQQRRSLSPVQEDMHVESTTDTSTSNRVSQPTTYTISNQQPTDFEMIDEGALPILTEGTEEPVILRDNLNICKKTPPIPKTRAKDCVITNSSIAI